MNKKILVKVNILLKKPKNPVKASLYAFQLISRLTTEEGRVYGGGERLVIKDFIKAKN
jgi:hypothetical protein